MSARAILVRTGIAVAFVAGALILLTVLYNLNVIPGEISPFLTYQAAVILGALWLLQSISGQLRKMLFPSLGERAYSLVNIFKILGYIILAIVGLSLLGVSPEVALAGGAFSGLIIGLGAQPILGNFFAGLVVLLTGFVKAGDEIRVAVWPSRIGASSFTLSYEITERRSGRLLAKSVSVLVSYDYGKRESKPIPADFRAVLEANLEPA